MHIIKAWKMLVVVVVSATALQAADWPEWRGPTRDGKAPQSPELARAWPQNGPPKLWESEPLLCRDGGSGSPIVADGRVYVYASMYQVPLTTRTLPDNHIRAAGWIPEILPPELLEKIDRARGSEERTKLTDNELNAWITKWIETNLDEEQRKKFGAVTGTRLRRGPPALDVAVMNKLNAITNRPFATSELFEKWLAESGLPENVKKEVVQRVATIRDVNSDTIICLNAADGKLVWRKEYPWAKRDTQHSTPCVAGGRCYVVGSDGAVYCLDAKKGEEVWKGKVGNSNCSPIVSDGLVIIPCHSFGGKPFPMTALDAATGVVKWTQPKVFHTHVSPVAWEKAGKKHVISVGVTNVVCLATQTGEIAWELQCGGNPTPVFQGDTMVVMYSPGKTGGITAYKLAPEKAEKMWTMEDFPGVGSSPIILDGHVYAFGRQAMVCVEIETGKELWRKKELKSEYCSPILADGKILLGATMLKADPTNCTVLARANVDMQEMTSPAFFDGKLVIRGTKSVSCYDLTPAPPTRAEGR